MRILIATPLYPPEIGGPATHVMLCEEVLPKQGFELSIVKFADVRHLPKIVRHLAYFWKVFVQARKVDLVYALDPVSVGFPVLCAAKLRGVPFILRVPGDFAWEQYAQGAGDATDTLDTFQTKRYDFTTELRRKVEHIVAKNAKRVIVPSEYLKKIVEQWNVSTEKISVVYSAFEREGENNESYARRPFTILSAGRLVPWKGFPTLVHAFATVYASFPEAHLLIAGEGSERSIIERAITGSGLSGAVTLLGQLPQKELRAKMRTARIFALNTNYEGLSHVLLEAMDAGAVIVTTNVGGNPELIENEKSGLLVSYNDEAALSQAMVRILNDTLLSERLRREALTRLQQFSRSDVIPKLVAALTQ